MIGIDDTIERRWGRKIAARGIYRDPVRSSHGHFVKRNEREQPKQRRRRPCDSKQAAIRIRQGDETAWTRFLV